MKFCTAKMPDKMTTMRNWGSSSGTSMVNTRFSAPTPSMVEASSTSFGRFCSPPRKIRNPRLEIHGNPISRGWPAPGAGR